MEKILSDLKAMRLPGMAQTWQKPYGGPQNRLNLNG